MSVNSELIAVVSISFITLLKFDFDSKREKKTHFSINEPMLRGAIGVQRHNYGIGQTVKVISRRTFATGQSFIYNPILKVLTGFTR